MPSVASQAQELQANSPSRGWMRMDCERVHFFTSGISTCTYLVVRISYPPSLAPARSLPQLCAVLRSLVNYSGRFFSFFSSCLVVFLFFVPSGGGVEDNHLTFSFSCDSFCIRMLYLLPLPWCGGNTQRAKSRRRGP